MLGEFFTQCGRAENEGALGARVMLAEVVQRAVRGAEEIVLGRVDAQAVELFDVLLAGVRGVVGEKRPADAEIAELGEERAREGEEPGAQVERAIEVEAEVFDVLELHIQMKSPTGATRGAFSFSLARLLTSKT